LITTTEKIKVKFQRWKNFNADVTEVEAK
jgi:hypothetical protein